MTRQTRTALAPRRRPDSPRLVAWHRRNVGYEWLRRAVAVTIALILLLVLSPVLAVIALLIHTTSPGPVLHRQLRIGRGGRPFGMYKFRSMVEGADRDDRAHRDYVRQLLREPTPAHGGQQGLYKLANDHRVTRVGAFLRRTSLDELPQLWNVVRGEMALVGPRPVLPWELELFEPTFLARFSVLPGMTGLWQISGRNALTMLEALDIDLDYVRRRDLALDVWIVLKTFPVILKGGTR